MKQHGKMRTDRKIDSRPQGTDGFRINAGEVCPSAAAPVLISARGGIDCQQFRWGLPRFDKKQLIFNARSESALENRMLRESVECSRAVILVANDSLRPVHDRMPLLLEKEEIEDWLFDGGLTKKFLEKVPARLERKAD